MGKLRRSTQFISLIVFNVGITQALKTGVPCPGFYCYGCPWATFACPIGVYQTYAALGLFPFYAIGLIGLFALVLGRFWCGWSCPFGTVQDLVSWARRRGDFFTVPPVGWTGLAVLGGALVAAWVLADTAFCKVCPAGSLFASVPQRIASPEFVFGTFFYVHMITLALALVSFYFIGRFWCRYLCPLGGIFAVFNRVSFLKVKVDKDNCTDCDQCLEVCPTKIRKARDIENSHSCIRCGKCIEACPHKAIKISASLRR